MPKKNGFVRTGTFITEHSTINSSRTQFKAVNIFITNPQAYLDESVNIPVHSTNKDNLEKPTEN